jgi:hypothetical protein
MSDYDEDDSYQGEEEDFTDDDKEVEDIDIEGVDIEGDLQFSEKLNPSDFKRGFGGENIGVAREGKSGRYGDPYDTYRRQIFVRLREQNNFEDVDLENANKIADFIPKNKLLLMNADVLCPSLIFLSVYKKEINSKNIEGFLKSFKNIVPFDFVRYIRYIEKLLPKRF